MSFNKKWGVKQVASAITLGVVCSAGASAALLDLTTPPYSTSYFTYGNTNSYSLPLLANAYSTINGGGTGPGNPYYINSSPGAIKDLIVVYTGSSGTDVTTNTAGFDNAYQTPSGSPAPFATTAPLAMVAPNPAGKAITNNSATTWDADVAALNSFLGVGQKPIFLFNNNETNADQNLAIWAKVWVTDPINGLFGRYLYLSNQGQVYGTGGVPTGNALTYNPGNLAGPGVGAFPNTDYVLSGGNVCLNASGTIVPCGGPGVVKTINHNLGANQAAYAADVPLLDQYLATIGNALGYTFHLELFLGCDPRIAATTCVNYQIDNGFEQLFIASTGSVLVNVVPEPNSLALLVLGILGFGFASWKSTRRAS